MVLKIMLTPSRLNAILVESIIIIITVFIAFLFINNFREKNHTIPEEVIIKITIPLSFGLIIPNFLIRFLFELFGVFTSFVMFGMLHLFLLLTVHLNIFQKDSFKKKYDETGAIYSKYVKDFNLIKWIGLAFGLFVQVIRSVENIIAKKLIIKEMEQTYAFSLIVLFFSYLIVISINTMISEKKRLPPNIVKISSTLSFFFSFTVWGLLITVYGLITKKVPFSIHGHIFLILFYFVIFILIGKIFSNREQQRIEQELLVKYEKKMESSKKIKNSNLEVILSVQDLVTYFFTEEGIVRAVEGVSFNIYKEETLGLVGETGCGKSVTALSILQLIQSPGKIISGKVIFMGEDLLQKSEEEIRDFRGNQITMMFQDPLNSINPVLKVGEQISEVFFLHKEDELIHLKKKNEEELKVKSKQLAEINYKLKQQENSDNEDLFHKKEELLEQIRIYRKKSSIYAIAKSKGIELLKNVGIPDPEKVYDRYPHELSGGMRQRIMIAMGLACSPKLLLADEPTTALDVTIQAQILNLLVELKKQYHTSILFITHDLGIISQICDRVAVMYSGNIVEYGSVRTIFTHPKHPYTQGLIKAIPKVGEKKEKLAMIPGMVPNLVYPPSGCRFHPRCKHCFDPCDKIIPKQFEVEPNHYVSCHLYDPQYNKQEVIE
ncbi:MAG: ABC transporter ATP-binding protein [Promethearchaeota archaeon]